MPRTNSNVNGNPLTRFQSFFDKRGKVSVNDVPNIMHFPYILTFWPQVNCWLDMFQRFRSHVNCHCVKYSRFPAFMPCVLGF